MTIINRRDGIFEREGCVSSRVFQAFVRLKSASIRIRLLPGAVSHTLVGFAAISVPLYNRDMSSGNICEAGARFVRLTDKVPL